MKHYGTAAGAVIVGDHLLSNSAYSFCLPSPQDPLPTDAGYFSGETYTLARLLHRIQDSARNDDGQQGARHVMPSQLGAMMFLAPRLRLAVTSFIPALRTLYTASPIFDGRNVKSFHETAIETGGLWRDWLCSFARVSELQKLAQYGSHQDRQPLWEKVASRFRDSPVPWPFERIDIGPLVAGIEIESDRMEAAEPRKTAGDRDSNENPTIEMSQDAA